MVRAATDADPAFPRILEIAYEQRKLGRELAERRRRLGLSQTEAALQMKSTQRIVSKIENGGDINITTLRRYMDVLGMGLRPALRINRQQRQGDRERTARRRGGK